MNGSKGQGDERESKLNHGERMMIRTVEKHGRLDSEKHQAKGGGKKERKKGRRRKSNGAKGQ